MSNVPRVFKERDAKAEELESTFSYDGYQVVRKELFAHLRDPAIVIRKDSITFNTACISGLEDVVYVHVMSQENEISENILLPDLAKQSESIEQQSGEIAERGMPT